MFLYPFVKCGMTVCPAVIVSLSISPLNYTSFTVMYFEYVLLSACYLFLLNQHFYHHKMFLFDSNFKFSLKPILSAINISIPGFFWITVQYLLHILFVYISHPFTFKPLGSLNMGDVSCRQYIKNCLFLIWSLSIYFNWKFSSFMFYY